MPNDNFILTTKDSAMLEALRDNPPGHHDLLLPLIRHKIEKATVVFREDLPNEIASIDSRVRFRVNGGESDARVLSPGPASWPVGMFLPITTPRGLALLGLREGQEISYVNTNGDEEKLLMEKVEYQPEASRRESRAFGPDVVRLEPQPVLRLVSGGLDRRQGPVSVVPGGFDDPGPSAA